MEYWIKKKHCWTRIFAFWIKSNNPKLVSYAVLENYRIGHFYSFLLKLLSVGTFHLTELAGQTGYLSGLTLQRLQHNTLFEHHIYSSIRILGILCGCCSNCCIFFVNWPICSHKRKTPCNLLSMYFYQKKTCGVQKFHDPSLLSKQISKYQKRIQITNYFLSSFLAFSRLSFYCLCSFSFSFLPHSSLFPFLHVTRLLFQRSK